MKPTDVDRRIKRRLSTPITTGEILMLLVGLAAGVFIYIAGRRLIAALMPEISNIGWFLLYLVTGVGLPSFLSLLLGMTLPSWRYKTICGALLLFVLLAFAALDVIDTLPVSFPVFVGALIRFGTRLSAALGGFRIWRSWQDKRSARPQTTLPPAVTANQEMPRTPAFLLLLSLLSIPATYISILLSMFITIGLSALLYVILSETPRVPVVLIVAAVLAPVGAAWASLKALRVALAPPMKPQMAQVLPLTERPLLRGLVEDVCRAVGARMPDNVILNADPSFYVTQGKIMTLDGPVKGRTLAIGLPLVKAMDAAELSSVLAHEFAHFSGRDTLYSSLAAPVFRGLQASVEILASSGRGGSSTAAFVSFLQLPSLHFLIACALHFSSITMIISRRRELRADWIAGKNYGKAAFASALRKSIEVSSHFPESMKSLSWTDARGLFSSYAAQVEADKEKLEAYARAALEEQESELNSHPTLKTREGSMPPFKASVKVRAGDLPAELAADEARLSEAFAPIIAGYQEQWRPEAADQLQRGEGSGTGEEKKEGGS